MDGLVYVSVFACIQHCVRFVAGASGTGSGGGVAGGGGGRRAGGKRPLETEEERGGDAITHHGEGDAPGDWWTLTEHTA